MQSKNKKTKPFFISLKMRYIMLPLCKKLMTWEKAVELFLKEGLEVVDIVQSFTPEQMHHRVKVSGISGLEKSAHNLSPSMILSHIMSTGKDSQSAIISLSQNSKLDFIIDPNKYEATSNIHLSVAQEYEQFINDYDDVLNYNVENPYINNRLTHPWFGALNPHEWLLLSMLHQKVHLKQLKKIREYYLDN